MWEAGKKSVDDLKETTNSRENNKTANIQLDVFFGKLS